MPGKSFSVRITLDGGADIKKQLEDIGASGKKAFSDLEQAARGNSFADRFGSSLKDLQAKMVSITDTARSVGVHFPTSDQKSAAWLRRPEFLAACR
jgi:hypothetical protein